jgi:hypothetical protein
VIVARALKDIPNQRGYRFVGITLDQERVPCIVDLNACDCYSVYRESDREPFWFKLWGWEPHAESTPPMRNQT